jgi:hypothetical protein
MKDKIKISSAMLIQHLSHVMKADFDEHRQSDRRPTRDKQKYRQCLNETVNSALQAGDAPWLTLGLQHIMITPSLDARVLNKDGFSYSNDALRDIYRDLLLILAPDETYGDF